jgi:23S rRNA (cytosine1962-C5)-methyltransferase
MSQLKTITLKPKKEIPLLAGHPWVFSEAIQQDIQGEAGELVFVHSYDGQPLGIGTWNGNTSIRVRLLTRDENKKIDTNFFATRFAKLAAWKTSHLPANTSGYRLVHAESDGLPGLIVDRFADVFVFQLHTAGMERLRGAIIEAIEQTFHPRAIVERSDVDVRKIEGLHAFPVEVHAGTVDAPVIFEEQGIQFMADVLKGQKTGFFLDQREARLAVGRLAKGKRVLNLFSYSGAFSVHAAKSGAAFVSSVDVSHSALESAEKNFSLNGLNAQDEAKCLFLEADIFDLLEDQDPPGGPYDLIICDPPALAKSAKHLPNALKTYTTLNAACFKLLSSGGILVTSSCSGRLEPDDFRSMLRIAAGRAKKDVRILDWITQPIDHAERLSFPEGRYLKTAILEVR